MLSVQMLNTQKEILKQWGIMQKRPMTEKYLPDAELWHLG
jgi:hypothetical protein